MNKEILDLKTIAEGARAAYKMGHLSREEASANKTLFTKSK